MGSVRVDLSQLMYEGQLDRHQRRQLEREYKLLKRTLSDSARAGPQQEVKLHWGLRELAKSSRSPGQSQ
jgi:hypothetical protein